MEVRTVKAYRYRGGYRCAHTCLSEREWEEAEESDFPYLPEVSAEIYLGEEPADVEAEPLPHCAQCGEVLDVAEQYAFYTEPETLLTVNPNGDLREQAARLETAGHAVALFAQNAEEAARSELYRVARALAYQAQCARLELSKRAEEKKA